MHIVGPRLETASRSLAAQRVDVLVSHCWGRVGYNIVRSLGRRNLRVAVGFDDLLGMAALSRYTAVTFRHPTFASDPKVFIDTIRNAIQLYEPQVYLPCDQEVLVVARHIESLSDLDVAIPVAPFEVLRTLHRKSDLAKLAASLMIPTPATIVPTGIADLRAFARDQGTPVVVKRISSTSARGVFFLEAGDIDRFEAIALRRDLHFGQFLVQRCPFVSTSSNHRVGAASISK